MEEDQNDHLLVKSDFINALTPVFLRSLLLTAIITGVIYLIYLGLGKLIGFYNLESHMIWFIAIFILLFLYMVSDDIIRVERTEYLFYDKYVEKRFTFIKEEVRTVYYDRITEISINRNLWDRMFNDGNIIIYSNMDKDSKWRKPFVLKDIKNPYDLKDSISQKVMGRLMKK